MKRLAVSLIALSLLMLLSAAPTSAQSVADAAMTAAPAVATIGLGSWINCLKGAGDETVHMASRYYLGALFTAPASCVGNGVGTIIFSVGDFLTSPFKKDNVVPPFYQSLQPPYPIPKK